MAVVVDIRIGPGTLEQIYEVERLTTLRGEALGGPPYAGLIFLACTAVDGGYRMVSAWKTEADFRAVMETALGPDLASVGLAASDIEVAGAVSMAVPGAH